MKKMNLVSSIVLSIALLSSSQSDAFSFGKALINISKKAGSAIKTVATNKTVQAAALATGAAVYGAIKNSNKKAAPEAAEAAPAVEAQG